MPQCVGTVKGSNPPRRCRKAAVGGTTVCVSHGAHGIMASRGSLGSGWKDGRHVDALKGKLLEKYKAGQTDVDLMAMRDEIVLIDAMVMESLEKIDAGPDPSLWRAAYGHLLDFQIANQSGNLDRQIEALGRLQATLERGVRDAEARTQTRALIQERARIVDREQKRLVAAQQLLTIEEVGVMIAAVMLAVTRRVTDRTVLQQIRNDIELEVGRERRMIPA